MGLALTMPCAHGRPSLVSILRGEIRDAPPAGLFPIHSLTFLLSRLYRSLMGSIQIISPDAKPTTMSKRSLLQVKRLMAWQVGNALKWIREKEAFYSAERVCGGNKINHHTSWP